MKKDVRIKIEKMILLTLFIGIGIFGVSINRKKTSLDWLLNLSADQIEKVEVNTLSGENRMTRDLTLGEISDFIEELKKLNLKHEEEPEEVFGEKVIYHIIMKDGRRKSFVSIGNYYLQIDGKSYKIQ